MGESGPTIPIPLRAGGERRGAERFTAAMPLTVDGCTATTEDLSTSGLSFRSERAYAPGAQVEVVIEYLLDGHRYPLRCQAEVVRCAPSGDGWHVGARLLPRSQIPTATLGDEPAPPAGPRHLRSVD